MRRREFITLLGGAAAMPMVTAGAQERMRRVGILTASFGVDDPEMQTRNSAFILALREFGWAEGKNVRVEFRSGGGKASDLRKHAAELVSLADVVLANGVCVLKTRFGNSGDEGRRGRAQIRCGPRAGWRDGSERLC